MLLWQRIKGGEKKSRSLYNEQGKVNTKKKLHLYIQPIYALRSGQIFSGEVVPRQNNQSLSKEKHSEPVLTGKNDMGTELSNGILELSLSKMAKWSQLLGWEPNLTLNISATHLLCGNLVQEVQRHLNEFKIQPNSLNFQITEEIDLNDLESAIDVAQALHQLGVSITISGFNTGFASLRYLNQFPIQFIKIDHTYVEHFINDKGDAIITKAMIDLSHEFKILSIANGVESKKQREMLAEWGCDYLQGPLFSDPIESDHYLNLLQTHDPKNWLKKHRG